MKLFPSLLKVTLSIIVFCIVAFSCTVTNEEETTNIFKVGASSATINPEIGMFIAGDKQNRTFTGIHDSIYAKAVVIQDGDEALALVTLDCIGLLYPEVQEIRSRAAEKLTNLNLPAERIIVSSNHIHSGPDVVGIWGPSQMESGVDSVYMEKLVSTAAQQVVEASSKMQPATANWALGTFGEDWVRNISEPDEIDRSVTLLQFVDEQGASIATLTNFACHPTIVDAVRNEVSGDYVGSFYREMANRYSGEHLFLQGAIGGWVQPEKGDQSFQYADQRGMELAEKVSALVTQSKALDSTSIDFRNKVFELPVANMGFKQLAQIGVIKREISETTNSEIAWFRIGPAQFITHPGETPPAYSFQSKEWMNSEPKFVLGLTLDAMGYILKPEYFTDPSIPHSEYLTRMSAGPEAGPTVINAIDEVINPE